MSADEHDYSGPAVLSTTDTEIDVEVALRGHFQPIDGRFHWYGRIATNDRLDANTARNVVLRTPQGEASGALSDPDPWNRYRITGTGAPPFHTDFQEA